MSDRENKGPPERRKRRMTSHKVRDVTAF